MIQRLTTFPGIALIYLACLLTGLVIGLITSLSLPDADTYPSSAVTVTTTSAMMDGGATAVGELENGTSVLLRGDWVAGQSVPAYAYAPGATNVATERLYRTDNPANRLWMNHMWSWVWHGLSMAGMVVVIVFFANTVRYMRRRKTERIVAAALS